MFSKMLFVACATTASVLAQKSNYFSFDITHDPHDVAIYVQLDIGRHSKQSFLTQIDTGSCNLVIPHECCETCNSDHKISSLGYSEMSQTSKKTRIKKYLGARFETVYVLDVFQGNFMNPFEFEVAVSQSGTQKWSGILGLCPQESQKHLQFEDMYEKILAVSDDLESPEFNDLMDSIVNQKESQVGANKNRYRTSLNYQVTRFMSADFKNMFSIYLSQDITKSKFTLGGIPEEYEKLAIKYHKIKVLDIDTKDYQSNYWSIDFRDARMGSASFNPKAIEVVLDTGCTMHQARKSFIDQMVMHSGGLTDCQRYGNGKGSLICKCSQTTFDNLPTLELITNEGATIYLSKDYWAQYNAQFGMCAIMFQELPESWTKDLVVFGLPFFKKYFSIFDNDNEQLRVGLMEYKDMPEESV